MKNSRTFDHVTCVLNQQNIANDKTRRVLTGALAAAVLEPREISRTKKKNAY